MDLIEFNTHSFIVKIWLEEPAESFRKARWRGHITHVPSGERRYLQSIREIAAFIVPYLISMGVRLEIIWRLRAWLSRRLGTRARAIELGDTGHDGVPPHPTSQAGGPPEGRTSGPSAA